jgi:AcrR family transcriptional regulator
MRALSGGFLKGFHGFPPSIKPKLTSGSSFGSFERMEPIDLRVPQQSRSHRTREKLVQAAQAEFSERGYGPATAKSIADRAGVATGTFYHYFPDKDCVLRELARERVTALEHTLVSLLESPHPARALSSLLDEQRAVLDTVVHAYVAYHRRDKGLHAVITERQLVDPELQTIMHDAERQGVLHIARVLELFHFDGDGTSAAYMIFSLLEGAVHAHVLGKPQLDDAAFNRALVQAILRIGAPSAVLPLLGAAGFPAQPKLAPADKTKKKRA